MRKVPEVQEDSILANGVGIVWKIFPIARGLEMAI